MTHNGHIPNVVAQKGRTDGYWAWPEMETMVGRGQPVRAQVDLTDANEERKDSDRQKNPLYGNRKTTAPPARNS
jgi:hypothetical protein